MKKIFALCICLSFLEGVIASSGSDTKVDIDYTNQRLKILMDHHGFIKKRTLSNSQNSAYKMFCDDLGNCQQHLSEAEIAFTLKCIEKSFRNIAYGSYFNCFDTIEILTTHDLILGQLIFDQTDMVVKHDCLHQDLVGFQMIKDFMLFFKIKRFSELPYDRKLQAAQNGHVPFTQTEIERLNELKKVYQEREKETKKHLISNLPEITLPPMNDIEHWLGAYIVRQENSSPPVGRRNTY